ncbi:lanthionine synthetase LanC family protein [Coxiella endosymbiont of Ornithodoros maritimus]|uniref:lanthionine synthetase LanC family protein n=1 Tax=Coxiella endosymbiont of Ornithodoros maritimus TaxID=1656172 RepID=UPI0022646597|nr:lanthionine synthetase LanC family protein [Coxiella endosymbiont of Ornithodoros maritimus]
MIPKSQGWPVTLPSENNFAVFVFINRVDKFMTAWGHAAAGIGLIRLDIREFSQDDLVDKEIDRAIQTTLKEDFGLNMNLCHGVPPWAS